MSFLKEQLKEIRAIRLRDCHYLPPTFRRLHARLSKIGAIRLDSQ
jgi:hypothetical protein